MKAARKSLGTLEKNRFVWAQDLHGSFHLDLMLGGQMQLSALDLDLLNQFAKPADAQSILKNYSFLKRLQAVRRLNRLIRAGFVIPSENVERFTHLPLASVDLEITSHCQAECPICPRPELTRGHGFMSKEHFYEIIDQLRPYRSTVYLCGIGEPLMHPNFFEFLRHLRQLRFPAILVTNGNLLTAENRRELITIGLDYVSISVQGATIATYRKTMNLPYEVTFQRIREFISEARGKIPVTIGLVETPDNRAEIPTFKRFWNEIGVSTSVTQVHNRGGALTNLSVHPHAADPVPPLHRCMVFNHRIFVAWNGEILACCNDSFSKAPLGQVGRDTLQKILEDKKIRILKQELFSMCGSCDDPNRHHRINPKMLGI